MEIYTLWAYQGLRFGLAYHVGVAVDDVAGGCVCRLVQLARF